MLCNGSLFSISCSWMVRCSGEYCYSSAVTRCLRGERRRVVQVLCFCAEDRESPSELLSVMPVLRCSSSECGKAVPCPESLNEEKWVENITSSIALLVISSLLILWSSCTHLILKKTFLMEQDLFLWSMSDTTLMDPTIHTYLCFYYNDFETMCY